MRAFVCTEKSKYQGEGVIFNNGQIVYQGIFGLGIFSNIVEFEEACGSDYAYLNCVASEPQAYLGLKFPANTTNSEVQPQVSYD